jgi:flavin-binding protein dodecin
MAEKVYKLVEVVGTSSRSFAAAAETAVVKAAQSLHNLDWFEVTEMRGRIDKGKIAQFQVKVKIGFRLD